MKTKERRKECDSSSRWMDPMRILNSVGGAKLIITHFQREYLIKIKDQLNF